MAKQYIMKPHRPTHEDYEAECFLAVAGVLAKQKGVTVDTIIAEVAATLPRDPRQREAPPTNAVDPHAQP